MMSLRHFALLAALAWMTLLFYLSHQPTLPTPSLFDGQDKLLHAGAYGLLGVLLLAAHRLHRGGYNMRQVRISALLASLYGMSDEIHQAFVPGRSAEFSDWLADSIGAVLATVLLAWLSRHYGESAIAPQRSTSTNE